MRDVIVIGAGPAGSSMAAALAACGWDVLLVERDPLPRHKVCGEFLSPEAQASLQALGIQEAMAELSPAPMHRARLVSPRGVQADLDLPGTAWGISRYRLDAALAGAAQRAGAELLMPAQVTGVQRVGDAFQVTLRDPHIPRTVAARAVVAACGRYSRSGLPPAHSAPISGTNYIGVKAHYSGIRMPEQVELFLVPGGYAGLAPIENGHVNYCLLTSDAAFERAGRSIEAVLRGAARWNRHLGARLADGRIVDRTGAAVAPVDTRRPADPWDRLPCLGDTAAMMPPLAGDGMAMALRSAAICAPLADDFLAGRLSLAEWEASYCQAWHAGFDRPLRVARRLQTLLGLPLVSDSFIALGRLIPGLGDRLVRATRVLD